MVERISRTAPRRGGRPSREEAEKLEDKILDAAAALFFDQGYGATSIESIARQAGISKRTFYARYDDKAAIFRAVVHRIVKRLRPDERRTDALFKGANVEESLRRIAPLVLKATLSPQGLALYRTVLAEGTRFPELALIMSQQGTRQEAITRIAELLRQDMKAGKNIDPLFAAEEFLAMITAVPQRRALGLGTPMREDELDRWANMAVDMFLRGYEGR